MLLKEIVKRLVKYLMKSVYSSLVASTKPFSQSYNFRLVHFTEFEINPKISFFQAEKSLKMSYKKSLAHKQTSSA